jgi:uncharacterized membrane protein YhaH (DUF805 family)
MERRKRYWAVGLTVIILGALPAWRSFCATGSTVGMYAAIVLSLLGLAVVLLSFLKDEKKRPDGRE